MFAVKDAGGQFHVVLGNRLFDLVNAQSVSRQFVRVHLHAHGVLLRAINRDLRDAVYHGDALRQHVFGVIVHLRERQRGGRHGQVKNRRVGRIDFEIRRRAGHVRRQLPRGAGNGRLHVLRGRVNIAVQRKLNGDGRGALRADRGHGIHARDGGKLFFQRRGHGRSHGFRARPGQIRRDVDRRDNPRSAGR